MAFNVGANVPTSSTVTLTVPAASGTIARTETFAAPPAIGNTTAAAGSFTTLSASDALTASNATASPPTTLSATKGVQWLLPANGYAAIAGIYPGGAGISLLTGNPGGMTEHARFGGGSSTIIFNSPLTAAAGTFTTLTANNGTLTASAPVLDLAQTWNNAAVAFTALRINVTNTNSLASSKLLDVQSGGSSDFSVYSSRRVTLGQFPPTFFGPSLELSSGTGFYDSGGIRVTVAGTNSLIFTATGMKVRGGTLGFTSGDETVLVSDANDVLAMRRGTNPNTFNIYNTFTSATNHERGFLRWSSNVFQIGTEQGSGGGTARDLAFQTGGTTRFTIAANGNATIGGGLPLGWGGGGTRIIGATFPAALLQFQTGSTDRLTIDAIGIIGIGGTTASFPALKRSSTVLQARLANDSDFCPLQGQLRIHQNAVSETITATHTLTLFDAAGTAYKVPCVAA
jgi:hypothetical protein